MSVLAVLLIIGSAVVGPIEAQPKPPEGVYAEPRSPTGWSKTVTLSKTQLGTHVGSYAADVPPSESLPELCERAMREIGIDTKNTSGFLSYGEARWSADGETHFRYAFGAFAPMKTDKDGWSVRCIPVPTGYRK